MKKAMFILYVRDQAAGTSFYTAVLNRKPVLEVPGMTEFELNDGSSLGLMPEAGIKRLLGESMPDPAGANGVPRCEAYMLVDDAAAYHARALAAGARELCALQMQDWGDWAGYSLDPDGHVLAFASRA